MSRIFPCLCVAEIAVLVVTGAVGFLRLDPGADRHVLLAVFALLLSCLIQVAAFTYLTVVQKMTAQAVHLGHLGSEPVHALKRLKGALTRWLGVVVLGVVLLAATGGYHWGAQRLGTLHFAAALIGVGLHVVTYARQYVLLREGGRIAETVLARYTMLREDRRMGARSM